MFKSTTVTKKGQITIPKHIREGLNLKPGDKVSFVPRQKKSRIEIVRQPSILELYGSLKPKRKINLPIQKLIKLEEEEAAKAIAQEAME